MGGGSKGDVIRRRVAYEAARILSEQGNHDFNLARRKAAARLGVSDRRQLPKNDEIHQALAEHQRLFRKESQEDELRFLRDQAAQAMALLDPFKPRLIGSVLYGTADRHSTIDLLLFPDTPEEIALILLNNRIPWRESHETMHYSDGKKARHPVFCITAGDTELRLIVLNPANMRNPPVSPVTERPEKGLDLAGVRELIDRRQRADSGT